MKTLDWLNFLHMKWKTEGKGRSLMPHIYFAHCSRALGVKRLVLDTNTKHPLRHLSLPLAPCPSYLVSFSLYPCVLCYIICVYNILVEDTPKRWALLVSGWLAVLLVCPRPFWFDGVADQEAVLGDTIAHMPGGHLARLAVPCAGDAHTMSLSPAGARALPHRLAAGQQPPHAVHTPLSESHPLYLISSWAQLISVLGLLSRAASCRLPSCLPMHPCLLQTKSVYSLFVKLDFVRRWNSCPIKTFRFTLSTTSPHCNSHSLFIMVIPMRVTRLYVIRWWRCLLCQG